MNRARGHRAAKRRRVIAGGSLFALVALVAVAGLIFSGVTQAAPSDPTTVGFDTVSGITLNGVAGTTITVAPGTDVSISANWSDSHPSYCPGCIDFLDVGFAGHAQSGCLENNGSTGASGSGTVDLGNMPDTPGTYDVLAEYLLDYYCGQDWNSSGSGAVVIAQITVSGPPLATINSPSDQQTYSLKQSVATSFSCSDPNGPGLMGCVDSNGSTSPGALDTSSTGTFAYTVTATSSDGKTGTATIHYTVAGPPTATIVSPGDGNTYTLGQTVATDFNCTDPTGTGIASCVDSSGGTSPGALDTSKAGSFSYTVKAMSDDGQSSTSTINYTVVGPPSAAIDSPADGQTFAIGQNVVTGFSCLEAANGPGIKSCVDSNGSTSPGSLDTTSTGAFAYSVTATSSDGEVGTATIHYKVATPPAATIASPADGQTYNLGASVPTSFSCQESADGPGISSCVDSKGSASPGALDTSKAGTFAYTVTAKSGDGQSSTATIHYTVAAPPTAAIGSPADGQTFAVGQTVVTGFSCSEGANGSGIASCVDSNGSASPAGALDTSKTGTFAYSVTATSSDGQSSTSTIHYTVAGPPSASIASPADGQTFNLGAIVPTSFSCSDGTSGPGISSCVDSNGGASPAGALDTSKTGTFAYVVTATSGDGQSSTATIHYTVAAPPSASIGSPADGQTFAIGQNVVTGFSCSEGANGSGIASCLDSNGGASPAGALDTSKTGTFAYVVTATSKDGQVGTSTIHYTVAGPPSASIASPADGQTYSMGATVPTSFSCSDGASAPGITSCVDSNGSTSPGALGTSSAGKFAYTVTATSGDGQSSTATIHYTVAAPPSAAIASPADGQTFNLGAIVPTSFSCSDGASAPGISSCVDSNGSTSPGALVTSSAGTFAYSVTAMSTDGQTTTSTIHYTVVRPPTAAIALPANGQTYNLGQPVATSFSCQDSTNAPGLSSCVDSNGGTSPGALNTSQAGKFAYVVTATSSDGQTGTATINYTVLGPPSAVVGSPADGQSYNRGASVPTSFSCSDAAGAPGISSCVDSNGSVSPGALVTSSPGTFAYSVTATSGDGQTTTTTIHYTVLGLPSAAISSPADGQTYDVGASVPTAFSCADAAGGPGIASCVDSNGATSPGALDTSKAGTFAYTVTATSSDTLTATATIHYTVVDSPSATIASPGDALTYTLGQQVATSFSCADAVNAPGIASCVDSNGSPSPGALDTSKPGSFTYVVTAKSGDGQTTTTTIHYTVAPLAPSLIVPLPFAILGTSTDVTPVSGTVTVKLPGSSTFTTLSSTANIPVGSTIDASSGTVSLTVTLPDGSSQTGEFYNGVFVFTQSPSGTVIAALTGGSFAACPQPTHGLRAGAHAASGKKKPKTVIRQLWGNGHGMYTTKGRYGSASVSGTIWVTEDLCDGTLIKAIKDNVIVVSFAHPHIRHNVHQGQTWFIPGPGY